MNYTITTNFGAKDGLASGNPAKLVLGVQFTTEFTNIATAIATKFDGTVAFAPDGTAAQPSYGFTNNAGTGMFNVAGVLGFATGTASRLTISAAGNITLNTPTSGNALTIAGAGGTTYNILASGIAAAQAAIAVAGNGNVAGTTSLDLIQDGASSAFLYNRANASLSIGTNNTTRISIAAGGAVTMTPTTGAALNLNGLANTDTLLVTGSVTSGQSYGIDILAGTTAADASLRVNNQANTQSYLKVFGDGGVVLGSATGGDKGLGSVNASAVYVNGVSVSGGAATLVAVKTTLTARSLTTTPANDPDLTLAIPGAGTYAIEAFISHYNATPSFGISCNLNYSGTYTANSSLVDYATNGVPTAATNLIASAVSTSQLAGNTGSALGIFAPLLITATLVATGAGTVAFSWAQSSSNASATNVGAGSYMTATKIA